MADKNADQLRASAAAHNARLGEAGGIMANFNLPDLRPYEPKATKKQKDLLWALGVQDVPFLEALGKWQAVAMIDQIKQAATKGGRRSLIITIAVLVVIVVIAVSFS